MAAAARPPGRHRPPRDRARRRMPAASPSGWPRSCRRATARCRAAPRPWPRPAGASRRGPAARTRRRRSIRRGPGPDPKAVPVAVERGHDQRLRAGLGDQAGVGGVDEGRPVEHVGMAGRRGVHLLLQHALVDGRHRPLRSAVDAALEIGRRRNEYSATERQTERSIRSVRQACSAAAARRRSGPPRPRRHRRPPCAPPRSGARPVPAVRHRGCGGRCAR